MIETSLKSQNPSFSRRIHTISQVSNNPLPHVHVHPKCPWPSKMAKNNVFLGYCGYCPMKKFQLGDTYGKTTADILTNDDVS